MEPQEGHYDEAHQPLLLDVRSPPCASGVEETHNNDGINSPGGGAIASAADLEIRHFIENPEETAVIQQVVQTEELSENSAIHQLFFVDGEQQRQQQQEEVGLFIIIYPLPTAAGMCPRQFS